MRLIQATYQRKDKEQWNKVVQVNNPHKAMWKTMVKAEGKAIAEQKLKARTFLMLMT